MALRVLGEAATRTQGGDFATIHDFVLSENFDLAAFKGQKLTFRELGRPAAATDPAHHRQGGGLGLAAGGVPAPGEPARHPRDRRARDGLQAIRTTGRKNAHRTTWHPAGLDGLRREPGPRRQDLRVEREGQHDLRARQRQPRGHPHHRGDAAAARHHRLARRQARLCLRLGRQPRAGLRRGDLRGAAEPALGSGPGALRAASERQPALHRQRGRQHRHRRRRRDAGRCWPRCRSASSPRAWA